VANAERNPGSDAPPSPDFAPLYPGYGKLRQTPAQHAVEPRCRLQSCRAAKCTVIPFCNMGAAELTVSVKFLLQPIKDGFYSSLRQNAPGHIAVSPVGF
jgi:hypothetical protein